MSLYANSLDRQRHLDRGAGDAPLPEELSHRLPAGAGGFAVGIMDAYRSGSLRVMDPSHLEGVVVFPSFHTAMAC